MNNRRKQLIAEVGYYRAINILRIIGGAKAILGFKNTTTGRCMVYQDSVFGKVLMIL